MSLEESNESGEGTARAHLFWDGQWRDADARSRWETPDPRIVESIAAMSATIPGAKVLDLGCGVGRHALALARAGFRVSACDGSPEAVRLAGEALEPYGGEAILAPMTELPYADGSFAWIVAWNVLYHGCRDDFERAVSEACRVLAPGGRLEATFISKRNVHFGRGRMIDEHTWIDEGISDKAHPHCYSSDEDLREVLAGFRIIQLQEHEQASYPGAWHWLCVAEKEGAE